MTRDTTSPERTIRPATASDAEAIRRIYNHAVEHTVATFDLEPKSPEAIDAYLCAHEGRYPVCVALVEGRVAGWGALSRCFERPGYADMVELSVYVDPDAQGGGIGGDIVGWLIDRGRACGFHTIIGFNTRGNRRIERINRGFGFRHVGVMREVGLKFGARHDLEIWQLMLRDEEADA